MIISTPEALDMAFKGMVIGIASSAPLGPAGVLTVQRTLNKGRAYGLATGAGVAMGDLFYAIVASAGLGLVLDFLNRPDMSYWLQLVGAALLFGFGVYVYRSHPEKRVHAPSNKRGNLMQNAATGFLITLGNPMITFLFLALFARFRFVCPGHPVEMMVGVMALLCGSMLWWCVLTYAITRVGNKFRDGGLLYLSRIIGLVVMGVSLFGFYFTLRGKTLF